MTDIFFFFPHYSITQTNGCVVCCYAVDRGILPAIDVLGDNALVGVCSNCDLLASIMPLACWIIQ